MSKLLEPLAQLKEPAEVAEAMLPQRQSVRVERAGASMRHAPTELVRAIATVKKHWRLSLIFAVLFSGTCTLITFLTKPVYEPVARIEIDPPGSEIFSLQRPGSDTNESAYVETQAQDLRGDGLAIAVIRRLNLAQNSLLVSRSLAQRAPTVADTNRDELTPAESAALEAFRSRLKINRDPTSHLVNISFASTDPKLAATVVNTLLTQFIEREYKTRHDAILQSTEWLARQLDDVRGRMEASNKAVSEFQQVTGLADLDADKNTYSEAVTELNRQLMQAVEERLRLDALLGGSLNRGPESLPEVENNPVVQALSEKLAESHAELSQAFVIYGREHPKVKELQRKIDELQTQLAARREAILNELRVSRAIAKEHEQLLAEQMKSTTKLGDQMAQYGSLKKQAQADADLYNSLYARVREAGVAAASKSSNIRIVDQARVLDKPTRPNRPTDILLGLLAGAIGGLVLAFLREAVDNRVYTPEDITKWIGPSSISILPAMEADVGPRLGLSNSLRHKKNLNVRPLFLLNKPSSPQAEAVLGLYTGITNCGRWRFLERTRTPQVLLITSALAAEGKTTVAINLAIAMGQQCKTCIVDANLRRPTVAAAFGLNAECGLEAVLTGLVSLEDVLIPSGSVSNLSILPGGSMTEAAGQLISSQAMGDVLLQLRQRFDCVIIDSPAVLPHADGRALAVGADGVVLVGRSGVTTREAMIRALQLLEEAHGAPVITIVLNATDVKLPGYNYYD